MNHFRSCIFCRESFPMASNYHFSQSKNPLHVKYGPSEQKRGGRETVPLFLPTLLPLPGCSLCSGKATSPREQKPLYRPVGSYRAKSFHLRQHHCKRKDQFPGHSLLLSHTAQGDAQALAGGESLVERLTGSVVSPKARTQPEPSSAPLLAPPEGSARPSSQPVFALPGSPHPHTLYAYRGV